MERKKAIVSVLMTTVLVFALGLPALAQDEPAPKPEGCRMLCRIPDLTEEQKEKIQELRAEFQKEMLPLRDQLESEQLALRSLEKNTNPDQKAIYAKIDEIAERRATIQKKEVAHRLAIRNLLTDEQKAVFDAGPRHMKKHFHGEGLHEGCARHPRRPRGPEPLW